MEDVGLNWKAPKVSRSAIVRVAALAAAGVVSVLFFLAAAGTAKAQEVIDPVPVYGEALAGSLGIEETTAQIMERELQGALLPAIPLEPDYHPLLVADPSGKTGASDLLQGPVAAPPMAPGPEVAFSLVLGFDGPGSTTNLCGTPPDTMGAVGPTQFIISVNCNIVSYNKVTGLPDGVLSTTPNTFFNAVRSSSVSDPHIRYDRLSRRWFIVMIDVAFPNNRLLLAVSNESTITNSTIWTLFFFQSANGTHTNCLADYPTPGIDANAIYIGVNQFCGPSLGTATYSGSDGYVVQKSSVLGAGPIHVVAFQSMSDQYTPQGVDNPDPAATEGYFLGGSASFWTRMNLGRVSSPASLSPTLATVAITTANQGTPATQPHLGNTGGNNGKLDATDNRPMAAVLRNGSLWTAMDVGVDGSCTGVAGGSAARDAVFWWEIRNVATGQTPAITQSGMVCDPALTNPAFYSYGTIMVNGQGHAALGYTVAGAANYTAPGYSTRLAGDTAHTLPTSGISPAGASAYNPSFDSGASNGFRRWGDYSYTSLDPCDDMTIWTIQEYANPANHYRERVTQLLAPPPATPTLASPATIAAGLSSVSVSITGTSSGGSGFYDTPASMSAETCRKRISASVSGGVTVNSVTYVDATHVTLNLSTASATPGAVDVTITNPDGQSAKGSGILVCTLLPAWRTGEVDMGGGWRWLNWFGFYNLNFDPWVYHAQHRWLYPSDDGSGGVFFWYQDMGRHVWTKPTTYPYLYRFGGTPGWLWYQVGSSGPRYFYNYATASWEQVP